MQVIQGKKKKKKKNFFTINRNKKSIHDVIGGLSKNNAISFYFGNTSKNKNVCLIMDEVDGMSAGDRG
jgi:hypothetical protein